MVFIRIQDRTAPANELVYQGPAEIGCECIFDEQKILVWASDPTFRYGSLELFLSADEARNIAKQLLHHAASIECGIPDAPPDV